MRTAGTSRLSVAGAVVMCAVVCACSSSAAGSHAPVGPRSTSTRSPAPTSLAAGRPFAFTVQHETFVDASRPTATPGNPAYSPRRTLPTDLYIPTAATPRPLIMFSHGYHGAPDKFTQLFRAWAAAGYFVAAPQFPLTSTRGKPYDIVTDYVNQPRDVSFILTQLLDGPLRSKIDATRIAGAGLSLGGATTYGLVFNPCCRDPRLRAAAIFDGVRLPFSEPFGTNAVPVLFAHIDSDAAAPYSAARQAFAGSTPPKWFVTYHTGVHPEAYEDEPSPHDKTAIETSIDFFDLTLLGDQSARARLMRDGNHPGEASIVAG